MPNDCCTPETNIALYVNHTSIKKKISKQIFPFKPKSVLDSMRPPYGDLIKGGGKEVKNE